MLVSVLSATSSRQAGWRRQCLSIIRWRAPRSRPCYLLNENDKSVASLIITRVTRVYPVITAAHNRSTVSARWRQWARCFGAHPTHHPKRSVQPFFHGRCHILPIRWTASLCFLKIARYNGDPYLIHHSLGHPTHQPKRHLDRFSRFSTVHARYQRTHRRRGQ